MESKELFDIYHKVGERISYFWRFSVWVHIVIIGWLLLMARTSDTPPESSIKWLLTVIYMTGIWMIPWALLREYRLFIPAFITWKSKVGEDTEVVNLSSALNGISYNNRYFIVFAAHLLFALLVLSMIWSEVIWVLPNKAI